MGQKTYYLGNEIFPDENDIVSEDSKSKITQRSYPFIHNPVVNHLKNETQITKQNRGERGYNDAQNEKDKESQKVLAPLSKKITLSNNAEYQQEDLEAVRRECCCPNMQDRHFGEACPNIDNTSIEKYGICSPWRNSETGNECAWYFQQFCSYEKKKAYWEAIHTDLKTKLNDAEKEAIRNKIIRTRLDVNEEIKEKYKEYLGKHKMPIPQAPKRKWVERMPFDDAATKLRKVMNFQLGLLEAQEELLDQMDSDNNEVEELRISVEAWKDRAGEAEDQVEIFKNRKMDINEEEILEMDKTIIKLTEEGQELVEKHCHYNKKLMAHYRKTKENMKNNENALEVLRTYVGRMNTSHLPKEVQDALNYKPENLDPTPAMHFGCLEKELRKTLIKEPEKEESKLNLSVASKTDLSPMVENQSKRLKVQQEEIEGLEDENLNLKTKIKEFRKQIEQLEADKFELVKRVKYLDSEGK